MYKEFSSVKCKQSYKPNSKDARILKLTYSKDFLSKLKKSTVINKKEQ
jgi:hypothetical protein